MVDTSDELAPLIYGFTPVNPRPALGESEAARLISPQENTPRNVKRAGKATVSAPSRSRKQKSSQAPVSIPAKKLKRSGPRCNLERNVISKDLHRTKPGLDHDILPKTFLANSTLPRSTLPVPSIEFATCKDSSAGGQQDAERLQKAGVKSPSANSSLGETYQIAFAKAAVGSDIGDQHRHSSAKTLLHVGKLEAMMENVIDDDSFFKCLKARPKQLAADPMECPSFRTMFGDNQNSEQEVDLCLPSKAGDEHYEGDTFFGNALEHDAPLETHISKISSSAFDQVPVARSNSRETEASGHIQELVSTLSDVVQDTTSRAPGYLTTESKRDGIELEDTDDFPLDEDDFPTLDEQECFECDRHGDKLPVRDAADSLACDGPDLIAPDPFADEDLDAELMNMITAVSERIPGQSPPLTQTTPPRTKLQWTPPKPYTPAKPAQRPSATIHNASTVSITPRMPLSALSPNMGGHCISRSNDGKPLPFIRPSFPSAVLPRSPVPGLSPATNLRTCFRIGEALNAACIALRNSIDVVVELYCRVKYSDREANGYKQFFELADLFTPEKPPSLDGVYTIWKGSDLWDYDSKLLMGAQGKGKIARVIGRVKRREANQGWELTILNVWEATWEVGSNLIGTREPRY